MTAQPDNAALIAEAREMANRHRKALREEGQYGTTLLWSAKRENSIALLDSLAAALAAAEEENARFREDLAEERKWETLWEEENDRLTTAEERAQEAERERDRAKFLMECADTPLMRDVMTSRDAAEAQVRELQEALAEFQRAVLKGPAWPKDWLGPCFCRTMPTHWPGIKRGHEPRCLRIRAVLARSAGRAET